MSKQIYCDGCHSDGWFIVSTISKRYNRLKLIAIITSVLLWFSFIVNIGLIYGLHKNCMCDSCQQTTTCTEYGDNITNAL